VPNGVSFNHRLDLYRRSFWASDLPLIWERLALWLLLLTCYLRSIYLLSVTDDTRAFMRTTAWAAFVTALESTGQGLNRLSGTIDDIRIRMTQEQADLDNVQKDTHKMQDSLHDAQQALQKQQEKLSDLDQLLKSFYEARKTEAFDTKTDSPSLVALKHDDTHSTIYIVLSSAPIPQTLDLQWHVYAQPKNSYFTYDNIVVFRWGQLLDSFRMQQLLVTYVADPKQKPVWSKLSLKANRVIAGNEPLIYGYMKLDPVFNRLIEQANGDVSRITMEEYKAAVRAESSH
jgi:hypothetical protein